MSLKGNKVYVQKPVGGKLYTWAPQTSLQDKVFMGQVNKPFCNATPYSINAEDDLTTYVSDLLLVDNKVKHIAYVECGYVE